MNKHELLQYVEGQLYKYAKTQSHSSDPVLMENCRIRIDVLTDLFSKIKLLQEEDVTFKQLYYRNFEWETNTRLKIVIPEQDCFTWVDDANVLDDIYGTYPVCSFTRKKIILRLPEY